MKTRQPDYSSVFMGGVDTRDYPDVVYELALESLY